MEKQIYGEKYNYISVIDMQSFWNEYLEEDKIGVENAWNYYFPPFSKYSLEEVYASRM